jgi:hypothetical protein
MTNTIWQSAFVAAFFALHPLHVESIAWVSDRKDVLSTFFWLLTMWAYLRYVKHPNVWRYLFTLLMFALGLMAKPMLVTLPFVLLLLDYWPLNRIPIEQKKKKADINLRHRIYYRLVLEKIPLIFLSGVIGIISYYTQRGIGALPSFSVFPLKYRIYNAFISYVKYIEKMFWPSRLVVYYPHPGSNVSILYALISAGLLLAATVLVIRSAKNHRYLLTGWFWYLGTLVPVIGIIQVGGFAIADRYTYITLTGLFIIIAWGMPDLLAKWKYKKIVLVSSAVLVISAMSICTYFQLSHWRNTVTLLEHSIKVTKNNFMAMNNLAWYLVANPKMTSYNSDKAMQLAQRACELTYYKDPIDLDTLAVAFAAGGRFSQAIETAEKALELCQSPEQQTLKKEIENRLVLYKENKPYIETSQ